jgi:hypothetical protein
VVLNLVDGRSSTFSISGVGLVSGMVLVCVVVGLLMLVFVFQVVCVVLSWCVAFFVCVLFDWLFTVLVCCCWVGARASCERDNATKHDYRIEKKRGLFSICGFFCLGSGRV